MGNKNGGKSFPPLGGLKQSTIDLDELLGAPRSGEHLDADWNQVEPTVIHAMVWALSAMAGTVQFGTTKNNRAYTVKIYVGRAYEPIYFDGNEEGRAALAALAQSLVEKVAGLA